MPGARTDAERDAVVVESMFAVLTGGLLAAATFVLVAVPVLTDQAHGRARAAWLTGAVVAATAAFCLRMRQVLRRF